MIFRSKHQQTANLELERMIAKQLRSGLVAALSGIVHL